jgi:hypothetical protein
MVMKKNSFRHEAAGEAYRTLCGDQVLSLRTADMFEIEWHHAAGHSSGRERVSFYPKNAEEIAAVNKLAKLLDARKAVKKAESKKLKAKGLPTSKAAIWRHLEAHGKSDKGFGSVDYKIGKYGYFVCSYGEPDGTFYYDSQDIAQIATKKLRI